METVAERLKYHERPEISRSMVADSVKHGLAWYKARYITCEIPGPEASRVMDVGSIVDFVLLSGKSFRSLVVAYPPSCLKSNGALNPKPANEFESEQQAAGVRFVLKQQDVDRCRAIIDAIRGHESMRWIESAERHEQVTWTNEGLTLRCEYDFRIAGHCIGDLKTTEHINPQAWRSRVNQGLLWLQDAAYRDAAYAQWGDVYEFLWLCVESVKPYRVAAYRLTDDDKARADAAWDAACLRLAHAYESGHFVDEWHHPAYINEISLHPKAYEVSE